MLPNYRRYMKANKNGLSQKLSAKKTKPGIHGRVCAYASHETLYPLPLPKGDEYEFPKTAS
jgi:hypothetical protein